MVRPGIMTFGIHPSRNQGKSVKLLPVMSFKTSIVLIKEFPKGYGIGYNRTYVTSRATRIATVPVGYGDGYGAILSNQGEALIRGKRAPVVGRISMDMCTLDVTGISDCEIGDEVVLMGSQGDESINADEIAAKCGTISYEVLCVLGKRAPRIFLDKGKMDAVEPRLRRIFIPDEERSISRIDQVIRRCLQAKTRDPELGDAIFYEMFETLFGKENRPLELRTQFKYDIHVTEFSGEEKLGDAAAPDFFKVRTKIEYTKVLKNPVFLIGCALNHEQLASLFNDELCEYRELFGQREAPFKENDFNIGGVRVDGLAVPIIRRAQTDRGYEVWCGGALLQPKLNLPVRMEIDIFTRILKSDNVFAAYIVYPTRGLEISFEYEGARLKNVREVSYFSGKRPDPRVYRETGKSVRLEISEGEWVFPTSGVTFIWDR
jgi:alanine racemase